MSDMKVADSNRVIQQPPVVVTDKGSTTTYLTDAVWNAGSNFVACFSGNNTAKTDAFKVRFSGKGLSPGQRLVFLFEHKSLGFKCEDGNTGGVRAFYEGLLTQDVSLKKEFLEYSGISFFLLMLSLKF